MCPFLGYPKHKYSLWADNCTILLWKVLSKYRTEGLCCKVSIGECCCISNGTLQHCILSKAGVNSRAWWIASASSRNLKGLAHLVGASLLDVRYCELHIACCKILCAAYVTH